MLLERAYSLGELVMNNMSLVNDKVLYKFQDAKKIYFARTTSKCFLIEKKNENKKCISLLSRNTFIYNLKTGMLLFSSNR